MVQIVQSYGGASVGDICTLKSGGPDMTVVGFEGPEPVTPVTAPGAPAAFGVAHVEAAPVARVAWITSEGAAVIHRFPVEALNLKAKTTDAPVNHPAAAKTDPLA
jgi:hypothetical protein